MLPVKVNDAGAVTDTWSLAPRLLRGEVGEGDADAAAAASEQGRGRKGVAESGVSNVMHNVIRSKGFAWIANHPRKLHYWSHAGHVSNRNPLESPAKAPLLFTVLLATFFICTDQKGDPEPHGLSQIASSLLMASLLLALNAFQIAS
jgi:hypothetical protein